ncbi:MAG TPA: peptidylprolyl isomerase [Bacteroides sp.]|nr:peptidylprolyl isomerase [Bacteroides sp.]
MIYRLQIIAVFVLLLLLPVSLFSQTTSFTVLIETSKGNMKCVLYEEASMHAENFVKLVNEGFFDGMLFHRVIPGFMIQTGDPGSRNAAQGTALGHGGPGYRVPAEFHPDLYHRKGVLAAARNGDDINPAKESSGSQFYIVQGKTITDAEMDAMESAGNHITFTPQQRMIYKNLGGAPHLDYSYTVFGELVEGFDVLDKIATVPTDNRNRPLQDVKIIRVLILK